MNMTLGLKGYRQVLQALAFAALALTCSTTARGQSGVWPNPSGLTFSSTGGQRSVTVYANKPTGPTSWKVDSGWPSWIQTVQPQSGGDGALCTITVAPNATGSQRSYTLGFHTSDDLYSGSLGITQLAEPKPQTITWISPPPPTAGACATYALSATSTSGLAVTFSVTAGPGSISGSTLSFTGAGAVQVTASVEGNAEYAPASVTRDVNVTKCDPNLVFSLQPVALTTDLIVLSATSDSGGAVTFSVIGGPGAISDTRPPKLTFTGQGSVTVRASISATILYDSAEVDQTITAYLGTTPNTTGTTIDPVDRFAWGENIGWTDWRYDTGEPGKGATIGQYYCSGLIWGENIGWIQLGAGTPADGVHYSNTNSADYGVNHDGQGSFSGLAWGENIGWIKFDESITDPPRLDLLTGKFAGYIYGENIGWIDLGSNGTHFVKTSTIDAGPDSDADMIADAWELEQAAAAGLSPVLTHLDKTKDSDGDGRSDLEEYLADSNPLDIADYPRIVTIGRDEVTSEIFLEWTSSPRRLYEIGSTTLLDGFIVDFDNLAPGSGATTTVLFADPVVERKFWQVGARLPFAAPAP